MKKLIRLALGLAALLPALSFGQDPGLHGQWRFYKKIFQGQEMPEPPSANLRMFFEFSPSGDSRLWWWREGENDRCQRRGKFSVEGNTLVDEVTWVDPENTPQCAQDPDMQPGKVTRTPFRFRGEDLSLELHLNGEPLEMVWRRERFSNEPDPCTIAACTIPARPIPSR